MSELFGVEVEIEEHHARWVHFNQTGTAALILGFAFDMKGFTFANPSSSTVAQIDLYDNPDGSGTPAISVVIPVSTTYSPQLAEGGVRFNNALYANVTAGQVKGSVYYRHIRH